MKTLCGRLDVSGWTALILCGALAWFLFVILRGGARSRDWKFDAPQVPAHGQSEFGKGGYSRRARADAIGTGAGFGEGEARDRGRGVGFTRPIRMRVRSAGSK